MWGLSLRKEEGRRGAEQDESSAVRSFQEGFRPRPRAAVVQPWWGAGGGAAGPRAAGSHGPAGGQQRLSDSGRRTDEGLGCL